MIKCSYHAHTVHLENLLVALYTTVKENQTLTVVKATKTDLLRNYWNKGREYSGGLNFKCNKEKWRFIGREPGLSGVGQCAWMENY